MKINLRSNSEIPVEPKLCPRRSIRQEYGILKASEDIVIRFYEDFLAGNPPYSGHSENNNDWIRGLVNDYYFVDGKPLGERNPKYLQDDYVKFIRFAQWRIDKSGQGILGFVTNHGFLASNYNWQNYFTKCLYRPFDFREYYHHEDVVELPRNEVMYQLIKANNIALITCRQFASHKFFTVNCTNTPTEISSQPYAPLNLFPLYLYPDTNKPQELQQEKRPNFSPEFLKTLESKLSYLPTPEAIFYYIYAIFHSPTYRTRYAEFLKIDFPRVPLTSNDNLFRQLSDYGEQLVHLLQLS